jgi:hypothetical protein
VARLLAIAAILLLTGCPLVRSNPVPAQIDPLCFAPVKDDVRWEGDPNDASTWDNLGGEVVPALREKLGESEVHRQACVQGLKRLDKAKVIDLGR